MPLLFKRLACLLGRAALLFCLPAAAQAVSVNMVQTESVNLAKVELINSQVNRLAYGTDLEVWGRADHWASPREFYRRGKGDCEDFVLAKYAQLIQLGVPDQHLTLAYVKRTEDYQSHMVLLLEDSGKTWVLDNFEPRLRDTASRKDLLPVYRFNLQSGDAEFLTSSWQVYRQIPEAMREVKAWRRYQARNRSI